MARTLHPQPTTPHLGGTNSKHQDSQPMHQGIQAVLPLVAITLQVLPLVAIALQGATEEQPLQEGGCMEHRATEPRRKALHLVSNQNCGAGSR